MRRRTFIAGLGGAAATWPLVARGQQPEKLPIIHPDEPAATRVVELKTR